MDELFGRPTKAEKDFYNKCNGIKPKPRIRKDIKRHNPQTHPVNWKLGKRMVKGFAKAYGFKVKFV